MECPTPDAGRLTRWHLPACNGFAVFAAPAGASVVKAFGVERLASGVQRGAV